MRKLSLIIGTAAVAIAAGAVAPSHATFKGANGLLVYQKEVRPNDVQLFTAGSDGVGETQITHFADSSATNANWSANGNKIVFTRVWNPGSNNEQLEIYTMNADGSGMKALPRAGKFTIEPNWTPDGRRIVFLEGTTNSIATINADGTKLRNRVVPGHSGDSVCVFADGKRVAFLRHKTATSDNPQAIFVARLNGTSVKRITPWGGYAAKIDCSPDGTRVAYSAPSFDDGASNVYTILVDGTRRVQLTHTRDKSVNNGLDSWSPDGQKIAFISNTGADSYQLYSIGASDGSGITQLTTGETHLASWGSHP